MESNDQSNKNNEMFLTIWFLSLLLLPILLPIIFSNQRDLFKILVDWIANVGSSIILAGVILWIINIIKKQRPRFSINATFLALATSIYLIEIVIVK